MERKTKKEIVAPDGRAGKENKAVLGAIGVAVGVLVVAAFVIFSGIFSGGGGFQAVSAEAGVVKLPVDKVSDGKAHFYKFTEGGKEIRFFVLRSTDGVVRAAFDACDVCFRERKGYRQEGDTMVCNNCGQAFPSDKVNEIKGGCNPAPLRRDVQGDSLMLYATDILGGGFYF